MNQKNSAGPPPDLETFLFQHARLRFRVNEPILAMCQSWNGLTRAFDLRAPTWFWLVTVFLVDEAEQPVEGRSIDLAVYADQQPDAATIADLFLPFSEAIREVWDSRHSRCYGFVTWDKHYGDDYKYIEDAEEQYRECRVTTEKMRLLLGSSLFSRFRAMDL